MARFMASLAVLAASATTESVVEPFTATWGEPKLRRQQLVDVSQPSAAMEPAAGPRRLQIPEEALVDEKESDKDGWWEYMHAHYQFEIIRTNMHTTGDGEAWISFEGGVPRIGIRGVAQSPRFGLGEITIVIDAKEKFMYTQTNLSNFHKTECVKYEFPKPSDNEKEMNRLRWRRDQVREWQENTGNTTGARINWTKSYVLDFVMSGDQVHSFSLAKPGARPGEPDRQVKIVHVDTDRPPEFAAMTPKSEERRFDPPSEDCALERKVEHPLAHVELIPPHQTSSALNDLLLILGEVGSAGMDDWPALFIMLSTITVPGDVSVMIEEPSPPHPESLGGVAFDYTATIFNQGVERQSDGSVWMNLAKHSFRLRGEANETRVGHLIMDVIARGGDDGKVYAFVNLTQQEEHQCIEYEYPELTKENAEILEELSENELSFFTIAELDGEDCGIFLAPLARDQWIHLWVDMQSDEPDKILRSEIHKGGQVLRRVDILRWRTGEDIDVATTPPEKWACTPNPGEGWLADLSLGQVHKNSIQLQDALHALDELDPAFVVLEALGLPGDVAVVVQEPEAPDMSNKSINFSYSLLLAPTDMDVGMGIGDNSNPGLSFTGTYVANLAHSKVRFTASSGFDSGSPDAATISVLVEQGLISVRLMDSEGSRCLQFPAADGSGDAAQEDSADWSWSPVTFDSVEAVSMGQGNAVECNRFTVPRVLDFDESVDFWYSKEHDSMCRLQVRSAPDVGDGGRLGALIAVSSWNGSLAASDSLAGEAEPGSSGSWLPADWDCEPADTGRVQWASMPSDEAAAAAAAGEPTLEVLLPAGVALTRLALAAGAAGLMRESDAAALSRLSIRPPQPTPPPTPPPLSAFDPDLKTFAFSFSSSTTARAGAVGEGDVYVDLASWRLVVIGEGRNVSGGLARVESRFVYDGDKGWAYSMISDVYDLSRCFSFQVGSPPPSAGPAPNPFTFRKCVDSDSQEGEENELHECTVDLGSSKTIDLIFSDTKALVGMRLNDLDRGTTASLEIKEWSTASIQPETDDDRWSCPDWQAPEEHQISFRELASWDLMRFFLSIEDAGSDDEEVSTDRRLYSV